MIIYKSELDFVYQLRSAKIQDLAKALGAKACLLPNPEGIVSEWPIYP